MKNKSSWILLLILAFILFGIIYYNNHQDIFYVKKANYCFKKNDIACTQRNLEKAFNLGVTNLSEREIYLNTIINAPLDIKAQEKLLKFKNLGIDDAVSLRAEYFIYDLCREINHKYEGNYIMQSVFNQKIIRWGQMPITYSIQFTDEKLPEYYKEEITNAFDDWAKAMDFQLSFAESAENANIKIKFNQHNPADTDVKKYVVAFTTPQVVGNTLKKMDINFYTKDPGGEYYSRNQVYNTALHEIAHALGVMGHSNNKSNIMYLTRDESGVVEDARAELSTADINTMKLLYKIKPDITNVVDKNSEYLPFLVLGDSEDVTNAKIREATFYIKRNPKIPNGYMDLAEAYASINEYTKAIKCLEKGLEFALTDSIREMMYYNISICNYYLENYVLAEEYMKKAMDIKVSENSKFLLSKIYFQSGQIDKAEKELKDLINTNPKNIEYTICLANIYLKEKKYLKSRKVLKDFVKNNPDQKDNPRFEAYGFLKIGL